MQFITISGNIGKDAETRQTQSGSVTNFNVGVSAGRDSETTWYRCAIWGTRGEKLAPMLTKGGKVTVAGRLTAGLYEGKLDLKVDVAEVALQGGGQARDAAPTRGSPRGGGGAVEHDLSDDVPFVTRDPAHERKHREAF